MTREVSGSARVGSCRLTLPGHLLEQLVLRNHLKSQRKVESSRGLIGFADRQAHAQALVPRCRLHRKQDRPGCTSASRLGEDGNVHQPQVCGAGIHHHTANRLTRAFQNTVPGVGKVVAKTRLLHLLLHLQQRHQRRRIYAGRCQIFPAGGVQRIQKMLVLFASLAQRQRMRQRVQNVVSLDGKKQAMNILIQDLAAQLGSTFIVHTGKGMLRLTLVEVKERSRKGLPSDFPTPISLIFAGQADVQMLQDTYYLDHPVLGRLYWMLAPIGANAVPNTGGVPLYEALLA